MAIGRPVRDTEADPFYDMLFNMLIAFVFCFVIALLAFNPHARKAGDVPDDSVVVVSGGNVDPRLFAEVLNGAA